MHITNLSNVLFFSEKNKVFKKKNKTFSLKEQELFKIWPVVFSITASTCRTALLFFQIFQLLRKHKNNPHFALIGIDLKENREQTIQFGKDLKITYPLTLDPEGKAFYSFAAQGAGVTRNIIIDKQGKIVFMTRLYDPEEFGKMCEVIDRLLD